MSSGKLKPTAPIRYGEDAWCVYEIASLGTHPVVHVTVVQKLKRGGRLCSFPTSSGGEAKIQVDQADLFRAKHDAMRERIRRRKARAKSLEDALARELEHIKWLELEIVRDGGAVNP